jgi:sulfatase maturation enzyme AslB (radical SAM superfamily)
MTDKPYCAFPWFHQQTRPDGYVSPCCIWYETIEGYDYKTFFNGKFMQDLREQFKQQIPHNCCKHCEYNTKINTPSYKDYSFVLAEKLGVSFDEPKLISQEVNFSTLCNLKCRMCSQERSSSWLADAVAMGESSLGLLTSNWQFESDLVKDTRNLIFIGGEPIMHQEDIIETLETWYAEKNINQSHISITTNMTIKISDRLLELLTMTKETNIICSIDAAGYLNDYIRSDSRWSDIEANMKILNEISQSNRNFNVKINSVYSVYNYDKLDNLVEWAESMRVYMQMNTCTWPVILDSRNLPDHVKSSMIEHYTISRSQHPKYSHCYDTVISHLAEVNRMQFEIWQEKFNRYNQVLDQRRGTLLSTAAPGLAALT